MTPHEAIASLGLTEPDDRWIVLATDAPFREQTGRFRMMPLAMKDGTFALGAHTAPHWGERFAEGFALAADLIAAGTVKTRAELADVWPQPSEEE